MSEAVIVSALQSGNLRRAVELLLDSYQEQVFSYCLRLVGLPEATVVYQHTLSLALENLAAHPGSTSLRAWLFRIARLVVREHLRRHPDTDRSAPHPTACSAPTAIGRAWIAAWPAGRGPDPEALERSLAAQPREVVEILELALWHELTLAEVAYVVEGDPAMIRRTACAGLAALALDLQRGALPPS